MHRLLLFSSSALTAFAVVCFGLGFVLAEGHAFADGDLLSGTHACGYYDSSTGRCNERCVEKSARCSHDKDCDCTIIGA